MNYAVRMRFSKLGRARYISHLDLIRCFQRAVCRAELSAAYSNGFHPHMQTSFAATLPLGFTSGAEILELGLTDEPCYSEVQDKLNAALPTDIQILEAGAPRDAFRDLAFANYTIKLPCDCPLQLQEAFSHFVAQSEIRIEKRTKKGMREVDLKPMLEFADSQISDRQLIVSLCLPAGSSSSLNPMLLLEALRNETDIPFGTPDVFRSALLTGEKSKFF